MSNRRSGAWGEYYGSFFNESEALTQAEQEVNATYIFLSLANAGWTVYAIAAILGNMTAESSINPGRWQSDAVNWTEGGYGLVQWTPTTNYIDWCTAQGYSDPSEMDNNLARIRYEVENGLQWIPTSAHSMTFQEFTQSTAAPSELAKAFLLNYERPADQSESVQAYRGSLADSWFAYLLGGGTPTPDPDTPTTTTTKKKRKYKFVLFGNKQWRNRPWQN